MYEETMAMGGSIWASPVISISLLSLAMILVVQVSKAYKRFKFFQNLPGIKDFSVIHGNLQKLPKTADGRLEFGLSLMKTFNFKFHRIWFGPFTPYISVYHPEAVKKVLQSTALKSRGLGSAYDIVGKWIGEGLIVTNGERWARSRRLLTPAFHFDILKDYVQVYNEGADNLFKKFDKMAETGESFDVYPIITLCTLEVILKCALGYEADIQGEGHPYAVAVGELLDNVSERFRRPWLWPDWIFRRSALGKKFYRHCNYVHKFAEDVIEKRKQALEKDGIPKSRRLDFIDILLTAKDEDGMTMTNQEIRNEVDTFMFAGHDTTASSIPWNLYTLAKYPEYQELVREEVDAILDGRDSDEIRWTDLAEMKTLAICVKETMRLYPPVPFIQRQLTEELEINGHTIPAGTIINIGIFLMHRNPAVWDDPEEFRPERFLLENKKHMDLFAFLPFSAGARNCIGQTFALNEDKVLLSRIVRRYKVSIATDHDLPTRDAKIVLRAENGIWLTLQRRDDIIV